jgi:RHS repeat-associated protein
VIYILYDGSGKKLRKTVMTNGVLEYQQDYVSGIEYTTTYTVLLSLEALYHSEGRVFNTNVGTTNADALRYEYSIRDHLGNTRLTFTDKNNNGVVDLNNTAGNEILQENHYYPFGLKIAGPWMDDIVAADTKYQYNGKGINTDFGLDWEDYGNRWYDPTCSRFHTTDKLSADFPSYSPYQYASNTPINAVDMDGLEAYYSPDGTFLKWGQISGANAPVVLILNAGNIWEPEEQEQLYIGGLPLSNFQLEQTAAFAYNETNDEEVLDRYRVANAIVNGYYFYVKNNPYQKNKSLQTRLDQLRERGDSHEKRMANITGGKEIATEAYAVFMNMDMLARNEQPRTKSAAAAAINAFRKEGIDYTNTFAGRRAVDWLGLGGPTNTFFWRETPHEPHFRMGGFIHIDIVTEKKKGNNKKKEKEKKKKEKRA